VALLACGRTRRKADEDPVNPKSSAFALTTDSETWADFETAREGVRTAGDPIVTDGEEIT
jgi:hypothetical protein